LHIADADPAWPAELTLDRHHSSVTSAVLHGVLGPVDAARRYLAVPLGSCRG